MRSSCYSALVSILLGWHSLAFKSPDIHPSSPPVSQDDPLEKVPSFPKFNETNAIPRRCELACSYLSKTYADTVAFPGSDKYSRFQTSFWSQQQSKVSPMCIFRPENVKQVSFAMFVNTEINCTFAVRSGGHATFPGASNIQDGMTFDMQAINEITISPDGKTAVLGTGNTWYDVYKTLEVNNMTAVGASAADVGVGGHILGGGISLLSNMYGWGCNNVINYEIIGAHGGILNVDAERPEMFFALCGGGNNFGIVTRFTVKIYPQSLMWQGVRGFSIHQKRVVLDAYVSLGRNINKDPRSSNHLTAFTVTSDAERISVYLENADGIPYPAIFDEVKAIPTIFATSKVQYMSEITKTLENEAPSGLRNTHWTYTFKLDAWLVGFVTDTFLAAIQPVRNISGIIADCRFQTLTESMLLHMKGKVFGLSSEGGPYTLLLLSATWSDEADDKMIYRAFSDMLQAIKEEAKQSGLHVDYLFMNYASQFQDVISSYGAENVQRLRVASYNDDPEGFLERLQPGYFKLNGSAPAKMREDGLN
ncbi:FAD binding domain-containing protein [Blastomyces dermatitidis ER-3]|uniref:FAD binding domain-containing protein n=1 Tax=Ajellomyces dermatitidis (strain ER-3 / ATCC MYA-2586) TaxID=559297 RepID=A0ABP2F777_AJEDR|nr:FAD binding domain-containing protein [Blastomyces dermatitidis ER-3]EEQ91777.2 FAD binding domain-containing protein [Blastomyces dermatitidis ER-3]